MTAPIERNGRPACRTSPPGRERAPVALPRLGSARGSRRLVVALLALYALALQSILGGLAMAAATGPEHVLCLAGSGPDGSAPDGTHAPAQDHLACCTVCHAAGPAALPVPASAAAAPAPLQVAVPRGRPRRNPIPRAPPRTGLGARAPPVV